MFATYLELGFNHLIDFEGYDHLLFIIALTIVYQFKDWKKLLILVTAFTLGHSLTLALAVLDIIRFPGYIIEWLIPITIAITAISNFAQPTTMVDPKYGIFHQTMKRNYFLSLFFGFIHGMGFSNFFRAALLPGEESQLFWQLLAFNLGIEIGQLIIVFFVLVLSYLFVTVLGIKHKRWVQLISAVVLLFTLFIFWNLAA